MGWYASARVRIALVSLVVALVAAPPLARAGSYLAIDSEQGDTVTFGQLDVLAEPRATFEAQRDLLSGTPRQAVSVYVDGAYAARIFIGPRPGYPLVAGVYENTMVSNGLDAPYLVVEAAGWCFDLVGRFVVNDIATDAQGDLVTLSVDFEGKCPAATAGFHGSLRYQRGDPGCASADDGTSCDDENPCTIGDACQAGRCIGTAPDDCPGGNQCQVGVCNPLTGACGVAFDVVGKPCDDGNFCSNGDTCFTALCIPGPPRFCDDADICTTDTCEHGACIYKPVTCPASGDPCVASVCGSFTNFVGCGFETVPDCCHEDADCADDDLCTRDTCDPGSHKCRNDPLECWLLAGKTTTTVSALGNSATRRQRFGEVLIVDEARRYRLPQFAGCDAASAVDELGMMTPGRAGKTLLMPANFEEERQAFLACFPPVRLRRRTGWIRLVDDAHLRGAFALRGGGRFRGVPFTASINVRFKGTPVEHVTENDLAAATD